MRKLVVRLAASDANTVNNREMPDICMQYMCAVMLIDGTATFISAHDEKRMTHPKVMKVRDKIQLIGDAWLQSLVPERHGIVEIKLKDGRTVKHHTKGVRGTAQNPDVCFQNREAVNGYYLAAPAIVRRRQMRAPPYAAIGTASCMTALSTRANGRPAAFAIRPPAA